jgi:endoglucanase
MTVIRLPFLLERVEPVAGGPLSSTELGYIDNVVNYAASKGIDVILDPHDYGGVRYDDRNYRRVQRDFCAFLG